MVDVYPIFDLFIDIPHPAASSSCSPAIVIPSPGPKLASHAELSNAESLGRIARFAFPDFNDRTDTPVQGDLNRFDVYFIKGFQHHTFSLQLSTGERVHGHVRRYLPSKVGSRIDVGRRGVRALVMLTRASGGDSIAIMMLKTVEGLLSLQASVANDLCPQGNLPERFLHMCAHQQVQMAKFYARLPEDERKPMMLTCDNLEFGSSKLQGLDTTKFLFPATLLQPPNDVSPTSSLTSSPILPLLRCLGVPNSLRLLSGLMSERRVLLISRFPTRLAMCARSALSMLAQGLLSWQHLYIPVLPPHLLQYLQAPMPYLIGVLATLLPSVNAMQDVGEVLIINLDQNALETRGIPQNLISTRIPDLFRGSMRDESLPYPASAETSASEILAHELVELLKMDKRAIFGESTLGNTAETAAKVAKVASKHIKSAFGKLRNKGKAIISGDKQSFGSDTEQDEVSGQPHAVTDDEVYTEGCQNELGEEEARVAFCSFYLCVMGDMRWYLSTNPPGQTPTLDRERFMQQKRQLGNGEGSPMFPLLENMCQSQMFEQFVNARVEEIRMRIPVSKDSPLFLVCANYHRQHQIDFSVTNVRRVSRQVAQVNPSRLMSQANASARRNAMLLTSNKVYEGDQGRAVAELVEACHETSILMDVMSVIWMRLRDCKGMNWKHGLTSLQILRNLLFHGPIAAIPEATDGMEQIRMLKAYQNQLRGSATHQVQQAANEVYDLLVDRSKLFALRRACANRRRQLNEPMKETPRRDRNLRITAPFRSLHPYLHPQNTNRRVTPAPSQAIPQNTRQVAATQDSNGLGQQHNLAHGMTPATIDFLGAPPAPVQHMAPLRQQTMQDMLGVLSISSPPPQQGVPYVDPFAPVFHEGNQVPRQETFDPFAPAHQVARSVQQSLAPQQTQPFAFAPPTTQPPPVHGQPHLPPQPKMYPGFEPTFAQIPAHQHYQQPPHPPQHSGTYPHQPNLFAVSHQAPPQQQQQQANVQQFDPLRKDPFG